MEKALLYLLSLSIFLQASPGLAETFRFTSYYPAPTGNYYGIHFVPQSAFPSTNCAIGTIYSNADANSELFYCAPSSPLPKFIPLSGVWTKVNNDIFLSDPSTPTNKKVGIGTATPSFKLTLVEDGGILSDDFEGDFSDLSVSGAGTRLIWYPKKVAFRAGYVPGTQWDDANIGQYSLAFGSGNTAAAGGSTVWGGQNNTIVSTATNAVITGGLNNIINATGSAPQILGGENNTIGANGRLSTITGKNNTANEEMATMGGLENVINTLCYNSTIAGGYQNTTSSPYSTISGGGKLVGNALYTGNSISTNSSYSTISGGSTHTIGANSNSSTISGGYKNTVGMNAVGTSIGGGTLNNTLTGGDGAIGGGRNNSAIASASLIAIGGGENNSAGGGHSVVTGGYNNAIATSDTRSTPATVIGGSNNTINCNGLTDSNSTIAGGANNAITATSSWSVVGGRNMTQNGSLGFLWGHPGASTSVSNNYGFTIYTGNVGIRDISPDAILEINGNASSDDYFALTSATAATAGDKFIIKNDGKVGVGKHNPSHPLEFGNGARLESTGNFINASSREYKENISDLPLSVAMETFSNLAPMQYNYKNVKDEQYVGFISEDVPELVVDKDRKGLAPLDIVAVLTKVVAHQQNILNEQERETEMLLKKFNGLKKTLK